MSPLAFVRQPPEIWIISDRTEPNRRNHLLHGPDYSDIIAMMASSCMEVEASREGMKSNRQIRRLHARLTFPEELVDLFHNGSAGYRAQYLASVELGKLANDLAVKSFSRCVLDALAERPKRTLADEWSLRSLQSPGAKVWIHQGPWFRAASRAQGLLSVAQWNAAAQAPLMKAKNSSSKTAAGEFALWAAQLPDSECEIHLMGGWLHADGRSYGTAKPQRAEDIHRRGFT
ncbi:MAG: hypothetical protein AB7G13_33005 [Lautropia sp.]